MVLYVPIVVLVLMLGIQAAVTWHASQIAAASAREAARVARVGGGTPEALAQADTRGQQHAAVVGSGALEEVDVQVVPAGDGTISATVTGYGIEVLPGWRMRVGQTVEGPVEEFRPDTGSWQEP